MPVAVTEHTPEVIVKKLDDIESAFKAAQSETETKFTEVKAASADKKALDDLSETVTKGFADALAKTQDLGLAVNELKKQLDSPLYGTTRQVDDAERKAAIDHERTMFFAKNEDPGTAFDEKMVDLARYRNLKSATRKLILASDDLDYQHRYSKLSKDEQKSLSMSQIDGNYFLPEVQNIIRDCFLEPVGLFDLYDTFTVGKMSFMYPFVGDHTKLGGYICSDDCGTITAAGINLQYKHAQVYDWRGTFCVTTRVLSDSAIDILALMAREMALSKRMTSNEAWINGDGVKQPKGWLNGNLFPVIETSQPGMLTAADLRGFFYRVPPEYGNVVVVMNPDTLALVMSMTAADGRFLFGHGPGNDALFPDLASLSSRVRLTRYMPNIPWTVTPGTATAPAQVAAPAGSLVAAAANWQKAYMVPTLMPMMMRQGYMIQGPWCAQYHFWAQDGGAPLCGEAGRVLVIR